MGVCVLDFGVNDVLQFDIEKTLTPGMELEITEYPVESGAVYSDGLIRRPRTWEVNALVSNTPLTDSLNPRLQNGQTRVSAVWSRLTQAWQNRQTFQYSDDMDTIPVAAVQSISAPRNAENQNAMELTITIKEIIIATAQRAKVRAVPSIGKRKNNGTVSAPQVRDPATEIYLNGQLFRTQTVNGLPVAQSQYQDTQTLITSQQSLSAPKPLPGPNPTNIPAGDRPQSPDVIAAQAAGWQ